MHRSSRRRACSGKPAAPIPIRPRCGGPSPVAPTSPSPSRRPKNTGSARCCGGHSVRPTRWTRSARSGRAGRDGGRLRHGGAPAHPARGGACGAARSPPPGSSLSSSRARPSRRATPGRACARWRTSTCCSPAPTMPARCRRWRRPGWTVVRAGRGRAVRHRPRPPRGAVAVPRAALRARDGVAARHGSRPRVTLWARRQPAVVAGTPAFVLPQNEELVVLAAHAGKPHHGFVRLVWIADIAMIVRAAASRRQPGRLGSGSASSPGPPTA